MSLHVDPNMVAVENVYAGVNFIDIYFRNGLYNKSAHPLLNYSDASSNENELHKGEFILGVEGSGYLTETGKDGKTQRRKVLYFDQGNTGSYAKTTYVDKAKLIAIPESVPFGIACALGVQGLTAHYLVSAILFSFPSLWVFC